MAQAVLRPHMSKMRIDVVEHALRCLTDVSACGWESIPTELHPYFAKYMDRDVWTGQSDLKSLQEAALLIIRDAITQSGEFASDSPPEY
jgi:hypothetical protein